MFLDLPVYLENLLKMSKAVLRGYAIPERRKIT